MLYKIKLKMFFHWIKSIVASVKPALINILRFLLLSFLFVGFFRQGLPVVQAGLKLRTLSPQPFKCWN
jgi:hypothetical protein